MSFISEDSLKLLILYFLDTSKENLLFELKFSFFIFKSETYGFINKPIFFLSTVESMLSRLPSTNKPSFFFFTKIFSDERGNLFNVNLISLKSNI